MQIDSVAAGFPQSWQDDGGAVGGVVLSASLDDAVVHSTAPTFGDAFGSAVDSLNGALTKADALAASVASGKTDIAEVAIARAKADVMLEVAAIAAARVSGAITQLMQTQV